MIAVVGSMLFYSIPVILTLVYSGSWFLRFWARPMRPTIEETSSSTLLGVGVMGSVWLGCALLGLYRIVTIVMLTAVISLIGIIGSIKAKDIRASLRLPWGKPSWLALVAITAPLIFILVAISGPETRGLGFMYHLAAPARCLSLGKLTGEWTTYTFQYPLSVELTYGLALIGEQDSATHLINLCLFTCGLVILGTWLGCEGGRGIAWWFIGITISTSPVLGGVSTSDNDLVLAGVVLGGVAWLARGLKHRNERSVILALLLMSVAGAVKLNGFVFYLGALVVVSLATRRWTYIWASLASATVFWFGWMSKSYLLFGDPIWPVLSGLFPHALWDQESQIAMAQLRGAGALSAPLLLRLVVGAFQGCTSNQPMRAVLLGLAILMVIRRWRQLWPLAICLAVSWVTLGWIIPMESIRLALPCWIAVGGIASIALRMPRRSSIGRVLFHTALAALVVASSCLSVWHSMRENKMLQPSISLLLGQTPPSLIREEELTTYWEARALTGRLPMHQRMAVFGDMRSYLLPRCAIIDRFYGWNLGWAFSGCSHSTRELQKKFRQANVGGLLVNFKADTYPAIWAPAFEWDSRQLGVWYSFIREHTTMVGATQHVDNLNGGFAALRLDSRSPANPSTLVPYLPGIQSRFFSVTNHRDPREALPAARALADALPNVQQVHNLLGIALASNGRWADAYREFKPGIDRKWTDSENYRDAAIVTRKLGLLDVSASLATEARIHSNDIAW